jgi:YbbR domain-containing protein
VLVSELPDNIDINVTGGGWELLRKTIWFNRSFLSIPIEDPYRTAYITGEQLFPLLSENINGIVLNSVNTDTIFIDIQPYKEKTLGVQIDSISINMRNGYSIISEIINNPDTVIIGGPGNLIDTLDEVFTLLLPFRNIDNDINDDIELQFFDPDIVQFYPPRINVRFDVARFIDATTEVEVELVNFPEDSTASINPTETVISFEIIEYYENRFSPVDFLVIADYNDLSEEDSTVTLKIVQTPQYIRNAKLDSAIVKVLYEK